MDAVTWFGIVCVGLGVGFLAGLFGKGGSAVATPLLHLFGVPAMVAVAAPLPATIPSTLAAAGAYHRREPPDRTVLRWSLGCGIPATVVGALLSGWVSGERLVLVTDVIVIALGVRFACFPRRPPAAGAEGSGLRLRLAAVACAVGLASGLLANSGGFLLAPLYLAVLHMPVRKAFASSLVVAAALAVPGTVVHAMLGHIDWTVVAVFGAASVPSSYLGARVALRTPAERLERGYGAALCVLGVALLVARGL
jgi:uncharacterized membrane protein YfcA